MIFDVITNQNEMHSDRDQWPDDPPLEKSYAALYDSLKRTDT